MTASASGPQFTITNVHVLASHGEFCNFITYCHFLICLTEIIYNWSDLELYIMHNIWGPDN